MRIMTFALIGMSSLFTSCSEDDKLSELTGITDFSITDVNNKFEIDQASLTIFNKDSLPYGTNAKTLVVNFSTIEGVSVKSGEKILTTGTVLDCSSKVTLMAVAEDGSTTKSYELDVRISRVNPDAVSWIQKGVEVFDENYTSTKAYMFKNKMWMLVGKQGDNAGESKLYTSTDGIKWDEVEIDATKFPAGMYQTMFVFKDKLYVTGFVTKIENWGMMMPGVDNNIWSTEDGITWSSLADPFKEGWNTIERINSASYILNDKIVLVGGNSNSYGNINGTKGSDKIFYNPAGLLNKVTTSTDGVTWTTADMTPEDMVLRRYSANWIIDDVMYMAGGQGADGEPLGDIWSSTDGIAWTKVADAAFTPRMKMQVINYNDKYYMIGGQLTDGTCTSEILVSADGKTWDTVDAIKALPSSFEPRAGHSVFIDSDNTIWIIGGFSSKVETADDGSKSVVEEVKTDVWSGKLNKL